MSFKKPEPVLSVIGAITTIGFAFCVTNPAANLLS